MRVVFFGSGPFALSSLLAIHESVHEVVAVITQPPRPAGRGGKLRPTLIAESAATLGLPLYETDCVNAPQLVAEVAALKPDVHCVVEFGQKVLEPMRKTAPLEAFNLHGSLLPRLRGAAPVNWAIIRGDEQTGVTTFRLVDRMDAGPVYLSAATDIDPRESAEELKLRLADLGAQLVMRTLAELQAGIVIPHEQDESLITQAPRLTKADGHIQFTDTADALRCRIHGTNPWPGAHALFVPSVGKPHEVMFSKIQLAEGPARGEPGVIDDEGCISVGDGRLGILDIKPAGKRMMDWRDFINGHRVVPGDRFTSLVDA